LYVGVIPIRARDSRRDEDLERVGRLPGEVKVQMTIEMTETVVGVCAEGIKAQNPGITDEELMQKLRERIEWSKRWQKR